MKIKDLISCTLTFLFTAFCVWWGLHFPGPVPRTVRADAMTFPIICPVTPTPTPTPLIDAQQTPSTTCSPTPSPAYSPTPGLEVLPNKFQNPNNALMAWIQRGGDSSKKKPGVILVHGHNWNSGDASDLKGETQQLADAGFFAASVYYELASNSNTIEGYIPGQPCHYNGTDPNVQYNMELDDIKNAVKAMRADTRCNGWVGILGASAGATLAIAATLDINPSGGDGTPWPHWFQSGFDDRPQCAVMLSAIYDFADWTPPEGQTETDHVFAHAVHNLTRTLDLNTWAALQINPVSLVSDAIIKGWRPIYMFNSFGDHPTAYHQLNTMVCLLQNKRLNRGTDYQYLTIPGEQHATEYWNSWDHQTPNTIGEDAIAFLKAQAGLP